MKHEISDIVIIALVFVGMVAFITAFILLDYIRSTGIENVTTSVLINDIGLTFVGIIYIVNAIVVYIKYRK